MSRNTGYSASISTRPIKNATPTSSGVCTPRYIRENGTSTISTAHTIRTQFSFRQAKSEAVVQTMFCVWPEGKE